MTVTMQCQAGPCDVSLISVFVTLVLIVVITFVAVSPVFPALTWAMDSNRRTNLLLGGVLFIYAPPGDDGDDVLRDPVPAMADGGALVTEWHGWSKGDVALHIGPLPGLKSIALYLHAKSLVTVLAYFRSEEEASRCMRWLDGELDADTVIAEVMGREEAS